MTEYEILEQKAFALMAEADREMEFAQDCADRKDYKGARKHAAKANSIRAEYAEIFFQLDELEEPEED